MPLTRSFKETLYARTKRDAAFRVALLAEGVGLLVAGDLSLGKSLLRDYINATLGFEALADAVNIPVKSLMRMFGPSGNPQANNLFAVLSYLQEAEGVALKVRAA